LKKDLEKKHKKVVAELDMLEIEKKQKKLEPVKTKKGENSIKQPNIRSNIIGLIFLIAGVILIINPYTLNLTSILNRLIMNPSPLNIKIGFTLVLIGLFLILLICEKTPKDITYAEGGFDSKKNRWLISEKITLILSVWVLLLFFITYESSLDLFFILTFIGTLVTKGLTDEFTSPNLKKRMNLFIFVFLIVFLVIISQNILRILNI